MCVLDEKDHGFSILPFFNCAIDEIRPDKPLFYHGFCTLLSLLFQAYHRAMRSMKKRTIYHEVWPLLLSALELVVDIMKRGARHLSTFHQVRVLQQKLVLRQKVLENL
jgi:hypothetical protein